MKRNCFKANRTDNTKESIIRLMVRNDYREFWKSIPWRKLRKEVFRLQCRIWKAIRARDYLKAKNLQKLLLRSRAARLLAIRQVTQLNQGKKTAGIDGKARLTFKERLELDEILRLNWHKWEHQGLRETPIPKRDGTKRMLKIPTIADRAWQCLVKYAVEPAHEALFHAHSYGFRPGRSAHDAQQMLHNQLRVISNGINKRILELDIEKCFDKINHKTIMTKIIAPTAIKQGLWKCLKAGINPEFPEQGTPQGGVISPLLANIALDGIERLHTSVRYADDMVFILQPYDDANIVRKKIDEFLAKRGLKVKEAKTRLVKSTEGFDFLGWNFSVKRNGNYVCVPSRDNYKRFKEKVKKIVNSSNYGSKEKAKKLAPIIRGWLNYHKFCDMSEFNERLWHLNHSAFLKFLKKDKNLNRYEAVKLILEAFPKVGYKAGKFIKVRGDASPYDGNLVYWSKRNSKLYSGPSEKALTRQNHTCGFCRLKFLDGERVHLHHLDGNHDNWKINNLTVVHESCHDYIHMEQKPLDDFLKNLNTSSVRNIGR